MDQPDSAAFLIVDEAHFEHPKMPLVPLIDGWETVAEMEAALGIPQGNLAATLDRYNAYAARGEDPDFHKQPEFLASQDQGPWGAFDMSLGKAMYAGFTIGGLATSVDGEVLRADGTAIAGLVCRRRLRVQHRPGRQGIRQRDATGGGLVLRAPGRSARGSGSAGALKTQRRSARGSGSAGALRPSAGAHAAAGAQAR